MPKTKRSPPSNKIEQFFSPNVQNTRENGNNDKRPRIGDDFHSFQSEMRSMFEALQANQKALQSSNDAFQSSQNARLDALEKDIAEVKMSTTSIKSSSQEIEGYVESIAGQMKDLQVKIGLLEKDKTHVSNQLFELEQKCENLERQNNKTIIQIRNVPKLIKPNKDKLFSLVESLLKHLNIEHYECTLKDVTQVSNRSDNTCTLIVELSSTFMKNNILKSAKEYNKRNPDNLLNSNHLGLDGTVSHLYLSEQLTNKGSRLFFLARKFAKTECFDYCWTAEGKVYLKKASGERSYLIRNEEDLAMINKN